MFNLLYIQIVRKIEKQHLWNKIAETPNSMRAHQVALEPDEVHPHGKGLAGVSAQDFDAVHQVSAELITSLQHTQHHDVMIAKIIHDISGQSLCPGKSHDIVHFDPNSVCFSEKN